MRELVPEGLWASMKEHVYRYRVAAFPEIDDIPRIADKVFGVDRSKIRGGGGSPEEAARAHQQAVAQAEHKKGCAAGCHETLVTEVSI